MTRLETHTYKQVGKLAIQADVYRYDDAQPRPVVIWIHGGALINGHRAGLVNTFHQALVAKGWIVVSIDYRLAPETPLPELVSDVEAAVAWVHRDGPRLFHADPQRVAISGGSAGGYLTLTAGFRAQPRPRALVALWGYGDLVGPWMSEPSRHERHNRQQPSREEAFAQVTGPPVADSRQRQGDGGLFYQYCRQKGVWPQSVSGWDPRTQAEKFYPYMAVKNVTSQYPPTLLIHGREDTDVPFEQSELMAAQFQKHGVPHEFVAIDHAEHGLAGVDAQVVADAYARAIRFLAARLEQR